MKRLTVTAVVFGTAVGAVAGGSLTLANPRPRPRHDLAPPTAPSLITTDPTPSSPDPRVPPAMPGQRMGRFKLTYYWVPSEIGGPRRVQLYDQRCRRVAKVSREFSRRMRLEGGGKLRDGRMLTYSGKCACPTSPCYRVARRGHKWGTGVRERPLSPFRSVAVDPAHVPIGSALYIPELDGVPMPGRPPWGGFVHNGCVVADDQGGGVRGRQIDLFAARRSHYSSLDRRHRLKKVTVFGGGERCQSLLRRPSARPGSS